LSFLLQVSFNTLRKKSGWENQSSQFKMVRNTGSNLFRSALIATFIVAPFESGLVRPLSELSSVITTSCISSNEATLCSVKTVAVNEVKVGGQPFVCHFADGMFRFLFRVL